MKDKIKILVGIYFPCSMTALSYDARAKINTIDEKNKEIPVGTNPESVGSRIKNMTTEINKITIAKLMIIFKEFVLMNMHHFLLNY